MSAVLRLLAVVALAGAAIAVVTLLTVQEREELVALHAESFNLDGRIVFASSTVGNAGADQAAVGTDAEPVELAPANPAARTALTRGHWTYTVVVRENATGALTSGTFKVELTMNGDPKGYVVVRQGTAEAAQVEGVSATFDLGDALPPAPLFFLRVSSYTPVADLFEATVKTAPTSFYGSSAADVNPAITFPLGKTLKLTIENADNNLHNLALYSGPAKVAGPTPDVRNTGQKQTLSWTPGAAGSFEYRCEYHASLGMKGPLTVT